MTNRLHRYKAVERGDVSKNLKLLNVSDARRKSKKRPTIERLSSVL